MILRLALALLMALLPMPASADAACHAPPPAVATASHHDHHQPPAQPEQAAARDKLCIGCVAPATLRGPLLAPPLEPAAPVLLSVGASGEPRAAPRPATPPPRTA